jgi:hypothetical protein
MMPMPRRGTCDSSGPLEAATRAAHDDGAHDGSEDEEDAAAAHATRTEAEPAARCKADVDRKEAEASMASAV